MNIGDRVEVIKELPLVRKGTVGTIIPEVPIMDIFNDIEHEVYNVRFDSGEEQFMNVRWIKVIAADDAEKTPTPLDLEVGQIVKLVGDNFAKDLIGEQAKVVNIEGGRYDLEVISGDNIGCPQLCGIDVSGKYLELVDTFTPPVLTKEEWEYLEKLTNSHPYTDSDLYDNDLDYNIWDKINDALYYPEE